MHAFLAPPPLRGRSGRGVGAERIKNRAENALGIRQHIVVPEPDDAIATRLEPISARLAVLRVLSAIDLDDELRRRAEEIDDIRSERMLAAETKTFELLSAQARP